MTEPLIITCETCHTRLRVRSAAAIGSILACPKCQSLVQIAAPEPPAAPAAGAADADPLDGQRTGASTARFVQIILAAACLAAVVAVGLLVALPRSPDEGTLAAAPLAKTNQQTVGRTGGNSNEGSLAEAQTGPATAAEGPSLGSPDVVDVPVQSEAEASTAPPPSSEAASSQTPTSATAPDVAVPPAGNSPVPPVGVPELDLDLFSEVPEPEPGSPVNVRGTPRTDGSSIAVGGPGEAPPPPAEPSPPPASSIVRMTVHDAGFNAARAEGGDPADALALPIADVTLERLSGVEVVRLVSDLTGVSITITPGAYQSLRSSPSTASERISTTTAGELLNDVLRQRGLTIEQHDGRLVVSGQKGETASVGPDPASNNGTSAAAGPQSAVLTEPVTFSFTQPTPLGAVLRRVEETSGLVVLVDWESLAGIGLTPSTEVTASVIDRPLGDAMDGWLQPLGLKWRALGDDAIWLTTSTK
jgi:hypothetical protein